MSSDMTTGQPTQEPTDRASRPARRPYSRPLATIQGDIRTLTLGGSPGSLDSGNAGTQQPPGGGF
jgi:hypothetical protein